MTGVELAQKTGIKLRMIYAYTMGSRKITTARAETVLRIARALDIDPGELTDPPDRQ